MKTKKQINIAKQVAFEELQKYYIDSICDILGVKQYTVTDNVYKFLSSTKEPMVLDFYEIMIIVNNHFER